MNNPIATLVALIALTLPQRKALGAHLLAWAASQHHTPGGFQPVAEMQALAFRVLGPDLSQITEQDLAVLHAAVYLSPARDLISARELASLTRAWTKLGWTWTWLGRGFDPAVAAGYPGAVDLALAAEDQIRAILNPPQTPADFDPGMPPRARAALCCEITRAVDGFKKGTRITCHYHATGGPRSDSCGPDDWSAPKPQPASEPRFTEPEIAPPQIGPQIREGGDVKAWLDQAITWADSLTPPVPPTAPATPQGEAHEPDLDFGAPGLAAPCPGRFCEVHGAGALADEPAPQCRPNPPPECPPAEHKPNANGTACVRCGARLTRPDKAEFLDRVRAPGWTEPGPPITPLFTHLTQGAVLWVLEALIAAGCEIRYFDGSVILTKEAALDVLLEAAKKDQSRD